MDQNNKSKFTSEEGIEKQRKEIIVEINKSMAEIKKQRKKKILFILYIVLTIIIFIKLIF